MESRRSKRVNGRNASKRDLNWRCFSVGKENVYPSVKHKTVSSVNQTEQVIRDVKANASKTLSNLKSTFDNISQKLRRSTRKRSISNLQSYEELENKATPVKLYSPFGIETPSPHKDVIKNRKHLTPRRFKFVSPTAKLKQDIEELSDGIRELHTVARSLRYKK